MRKYSVFLTYSTYYFFVGFNIAVKNILFLYFLLMTDGRLLASLRFSFLFSMAIKTRALYRRKMFCTWRLTKRNMFL